MAYNMTPAPFGALNALTAAPVPQRPALPNTPIPTAGFQPFQPGNLPMSTMGPTGLPMSSTQNLMQGGNNPFLTGVLPTPAAPTAPTGALSPTAPATNPDKDKWDALIEAGLATMAAAGRPGATAAGAIGEGGLYGLKSMKEEERHREAQALQKDLLDVKKQAAQAALLKAMRGETTPLMKNAVAAGYKPGTPEFQKFIVDNMDKDGAVIKYIESTGSLRGTPEFTAKMNAYLNKAQTTIDMTGESSLEKETGKRIAQDRGDIIEAGQASIPLFDASLGIREQLASGARTGRGAPTITAVQEFAKTFDIDVSGVFKSMGLTGWEDPSARTKIDALGKELVRRKIKSMGANPSNRDLQLLLDASAGLGLDLETNLLILDKVDAASERDTKEAISVLKSEGKKFPEQLERAERLQSQLDQLSERRKSLAEQMSGPPKSPFSAAWSKKLDSYTQMDAADLTNAMRNMDPDELADFKTWIAHKKRLQAFGKK